MSSTRIGIKDPRARCSCSSRRERISPVLRRREEARCAAISRSSACQARISPPPRRFGNRSDLSPLEEAELPYPHLALTSDHLDIAFHAPRTFARPVLVFRDPACASVSQSCAISISARWRDAPRGMSMTGQRAPRGAGRERRCSSCEEDDLSAARRAVVSDCARHDPNCSCISSCTASAPSSAVNGVSPRSVCLRGNSPCTRSSLGIQRDSSPGP